MWRINIPGAAMEMSDAVTPKDPLIPADATALATLDQRLEIVRDRIRGVARRHHCGFYLFGPPGTSKPFTVRTTLEQEGVVYVYHDGHLTPLGLFDLLAEHHNKVIVLDDVSAIFRQFVALQLLLAALGRQPGHTNERIISYRRQHHTATSHFTGGIIAISNLELHAAPLLEAIRSRIHYLEFSPTNEQMAALMKSVAVKGWPEQKPILSGRECLAVTEFLITEAQKLNVRLDMRLLMAKALPDVLQYRSGHTTTHWKDLVRSTLAERAIELKHTVLPSPSRQERKSMEQQIVREVVATCATRDEQLSMWERRTRKSGRAFYRRLNEISVSANGETCQSVKMSKDCPQPGLGR